MNNIILPAKMSLNDMSWKGIQAVIKAGKAHEYLKPGDTKTIILNGRVGKANFKNEPIDVFVLGIDHNPGLESWNRVHFGIGMKDGNLTGLCHALYHLNNENGFCMNLGPSYDPNIVPDNDGGWEKSRMRTHILGADKSPTSPAEGTLLAALPRALREVMVPTYKYTLNNVDEALNDPFSVTATRDSLWLLSEYEMFGDDACASSLYEIDYQKQYDYFKMKPNAEDRKIMAYNNRRKGPHGAVIAYGRSLVMVDTGWFCAVDIHGNSTSAAANLSLAVLACFAI